MNFSFLQPWPKRAAHSRHLYLLFILFAAHASLFAQQDYLNFVTKPTLIRCESGDPVPCFRLNFNFADATGRPVELPLPAPDQLASRMEIQINDETVKPFYAAADQGKPTLPRPRITLLLFDISGSMLTKDFNGQSRFEGAKSAASEFLTGFSDGRDRVAVVPFASRNVEQTIRNAQFVSDKEGARAQLAALPAPEARNNTALYSAVMASLDRLRRERSLASDNPDVLLILLTDGTNDVQPNKGDDAGLLTGPGGLQTVSDAVRSSRVTVFPIGLGNQQSIDEAAMARLGTRPPLITFDIAELRQAFNVAPVLQNARVTATMQAPSRFGSRALLAGRILHFRAKLTLANGVILVENRQAPWAAPPVATPTFEGDSTEPEQRALLMDTRAAHGSLWSMLRPICVFVGLAGILSALWFLLPRALWPERYDARYARAVQPEYWSATRQPSRSPAHFASRPPPPGFEATGKWGKAPTRAPGDQTIVQPKTAFDPNKTRLS